MNTVHLYLRNVIDMPGYKAAHQDIPTDSLDRFFGSTMDEVRLYWADEYAGQVLKLRDLDDASHFRHGVLRRELQGDVGYDRQRDHSAHTLNNYLLGWGFFEHSQRFREVLDVHLQARGDDAAISVDRRARAFGIVWTWASLLHDIGYLFEGSLSAVSSETQDTRVRRGVEVVRDFFDHRLWSEIGLSAAEDRRLALGTVAPPKFSDASLGAVADSLRSLPNLDALRAQIRTKLDKHGHRVPEHLSKVGGLPSDAFALWRAHYEAYQQPAMVARMLTLEAMFERLVWRGYPGINIRMLDHAVCSGLLSLQYTTLYYALVARFGTDMQPDSRLQSITKAFTERKQYREEFWWTLNVWGTAAAAIHNLIQTPPTWDTSNLELTKLRLEEDPIAYLGVLVDILEEWDRYAVQRGAAMGTSTQLPLQGSDVFVNTTGDRLEFRIPKARLVSKMIEAFDTALEDWRQLLSVVEI